MIVRNLILGEELPPELRTGYETCQCDPNWIWIAEHEGIPMAIFVTAPAHVAVILIVLRAIDSAPKSAIYMLLRHAFAEIASRGYNGYAIWLDPTMVLEQRFMGIIRKIGGNERPERQVLWYGNFSFLRKEVTT